MVAAPFIVWTEGVDNQTTKRRQENRIQTSGNKFIQEVKGCTKLYDMDYKGIRDEFGVYRMDDEI